MFTDCSTSDGSRSEAGYRITPNDSRLPIRQARDGAPSLDHEGYVLLREFLSDSDTIRARALVETVLTSPHETACERPNNMLVPLRWNDPIVQLVLGSQQRVRELRIASCADDLRWISGYISVKEPESPALWWHSDWWCWDHAVSFRREASQIAVLTYLDETGVVNGALRVLPGSHHKSSSIHAILPEAHSEAAENLTPDHEAMSDLPEEITLSSKPRDAVAIDYRLLHGTHANSTAVRRDCILLSFTPSWQRLPDDLKAHLIQHPALPSEGESDEISAELAEIFPRYDGVRHSLNLNRNAPRSFAASDD